MKTKTLQRLILTFLTFASVNVFGQVKKEQPKSADAQDEKQATRFYAGFNFLVFGGLSFEKTKLGAGTNNLEKSNMYLFLFPSIAYKLTDGLLIGLGGGYQSNSQNSRVSDSNSNYFERETYQFVRMYFVKEFRVSKRVILFTQLSLDYTNETNYIENVSPSSISTYSHRAHYFSPILFPGIKTRLSPRIDVELTYGIIRYSTGELVTNSGGSDTNYDLKRGEMNFGLNTITMGLKYRFFKRIGK